MLTREATGSEDAKVRAAFGAENRMRLIDSYLAGEPALSANDAWRHVYRLLLWIDQTTGLAHCYESDKCQPGKNWYARSLAFHDWLSRALNSSPSKVGEEIDWLFRKATADLSAESLRRASQLAQVAARQRAPYDGRGFPEPGEDPELVGIIEYVLGGHLVGALPSEVRRALVERARAHLMLENKRRNLVGEGFEDVLAAVVRRAPGAERLDVQTRRLLHDLPGFTRQREGDKPNKVDLAVLRTDSNKRTLVTAKWSVRADREKQFIQEYREYIAAEASRKPFEYVFVTNEFDPARLMRACEQVYENAYMFTHVVHINPDALRATYGDSSDPTVQSVLGYIDSGRLISLSDWLGHLTGA